MRELELQSVVFLCMLAAASSDLKLQTFALHRQPFGIKVSYFCSCNIAVSLTVTTVTCGVEASNQLLRVANTWSYKHGKQLCRCKVEFVNTILQIPFWQLQKKKKKKHLYIIWLLLQCTCRLNMFETYSCRGIYCPSALWTVLHTTAVRESYIPKREHKWEYTCIPTQNRITRAHKGQTEVTPKATETQINLNTCQIPQCTQMTI